MFGQSGIRYRLAVVWVAAFLALWIAFCNCFQMERLQNDLDKVIEGIESNNWKQADEYNEKFSDMFYKKKYFIQMNNATEIYITFEHTVRQLDLAVKSRQESALEYAGLLREALNYVVKPFSGP